MNAETVAPEAARELGPGHARFLQMAKAQDPLPTAVVHPVDALSLQGAIACAGQGLVIPLLVGPSARIREAAASARLDIAHFEIVDCEHSDAAAAKSVALAREGRVGALMKGAIHTDEVMKAVLHPELGLRTARRMSHCFVIDVPGFPKPFYVTDAAINIYPTLSDKRDIIQNAIDLAHALGVAVPLVAILSAVETVTESIRSTIDAASLCKMADRGQITGGVLDGPLAFDNAVALEAAAAKGIVSPVAGRAEVLVVPDLEAGNMLAKQLEYLAGARVAGIVLGARVPIMLTSRADKAAARVSSAAIAVLLAAAKARKPA
ncbi:bifunctional enoyl-CoA hydratase/phosphate acetyltransferase [Pseudohoeflea suaedae]|nr:bifunctional enoyl-CoA hydratase/phosphate acetyltransferase [Pseudohoeflea suaedae]